MFYSGIVTAYLCMIFVCGKLHQNRPLYISNGYVHDFSVDYSDATVDDILDIHNYLMKKIDIV